MKKIVTIMAFVSILAGSCNKCYVCPDVLPNGGDKTYCKGDAGYEFIKDDPYMSDYNGQNIVKCVPE